MEIPASVRGPRVVMDFVIFEVFASLYGSVIDSTRGVHGESERTQTPPCRQVCL